MENNLIGIELNHLQPRNGKTDLVDRVDRSSLTMHNQVDDPTDVRSNTVP